MKYLLPLSLLLFLLASCSTQHYIKKADFDTAISVATKKIRKNNSKKNEIDNLKYAFNKANQIDHARLDLLLESGADDIWAEIHHRYTMLNKRQDIVKTLPDDILFDIGYKEVNYGQQLSQSKQNAAAFFYEKGRTLMAKQEKYAARDAHANFTKAKKYYSNYKDVDHWINEAIFFGTNHILFRMVNQSRVAIPEDFEAELLKISLSSLNQKWIDYDTKSQKGIPYDYFIQLSIKSIAVSPESSNTNTFVEEKEISAGFKYQKDRNGNVQKDTAGNDIKLPLYKIITCKVQETVQYKEAIITGTIDYINTTNNQLVRTRPVNAKMVFDHHYALAFGNIKALKPETYKIIGGKPIPYPTNPQMIMDAATTLKNNTKSILYSNRNWLKN